MFLKNFKSHLRLLAELFSCKCKLFFHIVAYKESNCINHNLSIKVNPFGRNAAGKGIHRIINLVAN